MIDLLSSLSKTNHSFAVAEGKPQLVSLAQAGNEISHESLKREGCFSCGVVAAFVFSVHRRQPLQPPLAVASSPTCAATSLGIAAPRRSPSTPPLPLLVAGKSPSSSSRLRRRSELVAGRLPSSFVVVPPLGEFVSSSPSRRCPRLVRPSPLAPVAVWSSALFR
uniref:Uncharacterized protein n=1 Tax=Oryza sativa subsp. japonica TaxID=39947 RepID=Q67W33_ORYSJ|nr:hypothetical protein [Oryza sativa Japonica Group]